MKDLLVLRIVASFIIPFIVVFALYVQLHGEYSPGGGFQAGVILAAAFALYCLIWGLQPVLRVISLPVLRVISAIGVLLYAGTGMVALIHNRPFLDYDILKHDPVHGQHLGIILAEAGVGLTVFSVMLLIFLTFVARKPD